MRHTNRELAYDIHNSMHDCRIHTVACLYCDIGKHDARNDTHRQHQRHVRVGRTPVVQAVIESEIDEGKMRQPPFDSVQQDRLSCAIFFDLKSEEIPAPTDFLA